MDLLEIIKLVLKLASIKANTNYEIRIYFYREFLERRKYLEKFLDE